MPRSVRWPFLATCVALLAIAAPPVTSAEARGGGGGGGRMGGKSKGTGTVQGRIDYLDDLQHEADEAELPAFLSDAADEALRHERAADRVFGNS